PTGAPHPSADLSGYAPAHPTIDATAMLYTGRVARESTADNLRDRIGAWTHAIQRLTPRAHSDPGHALPNADTPWAVDCRATLPGSRATVTPKYRIDQRVATRPGNQLPTTQRALP
ncbi:hypothetical protein, partial [Stenotrophomonas sp. PS02289]|uniref:hypothetical protein n=1 Tax=Stenotrophomonas sp. PS02289 TaxID=2991422 RepID=UPI002499BDCC